MSDAWTWDETLFSGAAAYYARGRLPYPSSLAERFRSAADLHGQPRLIDVGCGPGTVAISLAHLFVDVVGVDPDAAMLTEARRLAEHLALTNLRWVMLRAEELPAGLGRFRYATFAQSFHWMDRPKVAGLLFDMLEPGGAFVHVNTVVAEPPPPPPLPHPVPPKDAVAELVTSYLGPERRAGRGVRTSSPDNERAVLAEAGFLVPREVLVEGRQVLRRSVDDVVAEVFSTSSSAPHLYRDQLDRFEGDLRSMLEAASDRGWFSEWLGDVELDFYERP
jgi:ubiquinone/menaquinone biosynthesis C-methylase UbiE